jgi:hypothetical protein
MLGLIYSETYRELDSHRWASHQWWATASRPRWKQRAQRRGWIVFLVSMEIYSSISESRYHESSNNQTNSEYYQIWWHCIRVWTFCNMRELAGWIEQYEISIERSGNRGECRIVSYRVDPLAIWLLVARSAISIISDEDRSSWASPDPDESDIGWCRPAW